MTIREMVDGNRLAAGAALFVLGLALQPAVRWITAGERGAAVAPFAGGPPAEGPTRGGADDCVGCEMGDSNPFLHFSPTGHCSIQDANDLAGRPR